MSVLPVRNHQILPSCETKTSTARGVSKCSSVFVEMGIAQAAKNGLREARTHDLLRVKQT